MSLLRAVTTIGGYTLLSRLFGFVRDVLVARYLGAGIAADAFFVAFKLPNFLRRLFAEGAFNAAFVPLYAGRLEAEGQDSARRFAEETFAMLAVILLLLVALAEIAMPFVVMIFAPGFSDDPDKFDLAVTLSRLTFPYILFVSLLTLLSGILNSVQRYAAVAAAPVFLNICLMAALLLMTPYVESSAHALAWGVMLAGLVQFVWLLIACDRAGLMPQLRRPRMTPGTKRLLKLAAPAAFGAGVAQVNLLIDVVLASTMSGAVSYIYYADRINELPIGVIGVAIGTALLPMLSRSVRSGNPEQTHHTFNQALLLSLLLTIPATVALMVIPEPIIRSIYQYGAFTAADSAAVIPTLVAFAFGLPAFILVKVFSPGFFAREDTKTPVKIALFCMGVNVVLNLILMQFLAHVGLALATSIAGWCNAGLMGWILYKRGHFLPDPGLRLALGKMLLASLLMGLALFFLKDMFSWDSLIQRIIGLTVLVSVGMAVFGGAALMLRIIPGAELKRLLKRG